MPDDVPRRMICICNNLGLHRPFYMPEQSGRDYQPSRYLKLLDQFRDDYTVFSGVSLPSVDGGHIAEKSFLTGAPHPGSGSFKNSISLDQLAADYIGRETRFPSLVLSGRGGSNSISWTRSGVPIPGEARPSRVFEKLFLAGSPKEIEAQIQSLREGQSIMDTVLDQTRSLHRRLNTTDRAKFDEYLTSLREVEQQMVRLQEWEKTPKPKVDAKPPRDIKDNADVIGKAQLLFDLAHLAFETDSTRIITVLMQGDFLVPPIDGVTEGYHTVSHHGQNKKKIEQLAMIEEEHIRQFGQLIGKLKNTKEDGGSLLDRTMVLYGSNLGNASSHDNTNLPIILAGGGFQHGQHLVFDEKNNYPLPNLFVSMLQRLGIETDRFSSSTGTMRGLKLT
ncbi:DUF1552 domain-containing protein [Thalassoglobus sp. JC818]|uniref:DUF1552 domain-containing protein n=1 Tax=Thalassoglobus sp. JC818 TaxID=3232136 RepID=UPI00345983BE